MKLRLHVFPPSPRAFKVLVVAHYLGLDYELAFCDLTKGDQKSAAYTAINPNQRMPSLEDGDFRLESGLLPADERSRADVARWQFWESTTWIRRARCSCSSG